MNKVAEKKLKDLAEETVRYAEELKKRRVFRQRLTQSLVEIRADEFQSRNWDVTEFLKLVDDKYGLSIPLKEGHLDVDAAVVTHEQKYFMFKIKYGI